MIPERRPTAVCPDARVHLLVLAELTDGNADDFDERKVHLSWGCQG